MFLAGIIVVWWVFFFFKTKNISIHWWFFIAQFGNRGIICASRDIFLPRSSFSFGLKDFQSLKIETVYEDFQNPSSVHESFNLTSDVKSRWQTIPDSKVHGANMGPTWVLLAPDGPHVGPMNLAIWDVKQRHFPHIDVNNDVMMWFWRFLSIFMFKGGGVIL